jgi:hypothetical protein
LHDLELIHKAVSHTWYAAYAGFYLPWTL